MIKSTLSAVQKIAKILKKAPCLLSSLPTAGRSLPTGSLPRPRSTLNLRKYEDFPILSHLGLTFNVIWISHLDSSPSSLPHRLDLSSRLAASAKLLLFHFPLFSHQPPIFNLGSSNCFAILQNLQIT